MAVIQVLELVGTSTLEDSLQCTNKNGIVCMTGMVGNKWALDNFSPMESIPEAVYLTKYSGNDLCNWAIDQAAIPAQQTMLHDYA